MNQFLKFPRSFGLNSLRVRSIGLFIKKRKIAIFSVVAGIAVVVSVGALIWSSLIRETARASFVEVGFGVSGYTYDGLSENIIVPVLLSQPSSENINVSYSVTGGSAVLGTDYSFGQTTSIVPAGERGFGIPITLNQTSYSNTSRTIQLTLTGVTGSNSVLGSQTVFDATIQYPTINQTVHSLAGGLDGSVLPVKNGIKTWYSADTLAGSNGSAVTSWNDLSGNSINLNQSSSTKQPILVSNALNGKNAVRFDGVNDALTSTPTSITNQATAYSIFVVSSSSAITSERTLVSVTNSSEENGISITQSATNGQFMHKVPSVGSTTASINSAFSQSIPTLIQADYSSSTQVLRINNQTNSQSHSVGVFGASTDTLRLGELTSSQNWFSGDIAEVLIYTSSLTESQKQSIRCYLSSKYALSVADCGLSPKIHLDASDLTVSNNSPVSSWDNKAGTGNDFVQGTSNNQPQLRTNVVNGKKVVYFDGNDDFLTSTSINGINADWFVVYNNETTSSDRRLLRNNGSVNNGGYVGIGYQASLGTSVVYDFIGWGSGGYSTNQSSYTIGRLTKTGNQSNYYVNNGASIASINATTAGGPDTMQIGQNGNSWLGGVAEVIMTEGNMSEASRVILANYLSDKYSITITNDLFGYDTNDTLAGIGGASTGGVYSGRSNGLRVSSFDDSLGSGEYVFFGSTNSSFGSTSSGVSSPLQARTKRVWGLTKTSINGVNSELEFDLTTLGSITNSVNPANYRLVYSTSENGMYSEVASTVSYVDNKLTFSVADSNLLNGYYALATTDSSPSPLFSYSIAMPNAISNLVTSYNVASTNVDLSFTAPPTNGTTIVDYSIEYSNDNFAENIFVYNDGVSTNTTYSLPGFLNGPDYSFRVRPITSLGIVGQGSNVTTARISLSNFTATPNVSIVSGGGEVIINGANIAKDNGINLPITITNTTSSPIQEFVYKLDTASLIAQNKLASDCSNLRIKDTNQTTDLSYWIESGCNTNATLVWVRLSTPLAINATKVIHINYANYSLFLSKSNKNAFSFASLISLPSRTLHIDATSDSMRSNANNAVISTWNDSSPASRNLTVQSGFVGGLYKTNGINGLPSVTFGGNTSYQFSEMTNIRTGFWVYNQTAPGNGSGSFLLGHTSLYDFHSEYPALYSGWANTAVTMGVTKLNGVVINGYGQGVTLNQPSTISLVTTGNVSANTLNKDRTFHGPFVGDYSELIVYNTPLSSGDVAIVEGYLSKKYGLNNAQPSMTVGSEVYTPTVEVSFGTNNNGQVISSTTRQIRVIVPPSPLGGNQTGNVDLTVRNIPQSQARVRINHFSYALPTVVGASPSNGHTDGGNDVVLTTNLDLVTTTRNTREYILENKENSQITNNQFLLTLNTSSLISANKLDSSCSNLIVQDNEGAVPYWLNSSTCNTQNTEIWIKTSIEPSSTKKIYVEYDTSGLTSLSNGESVFEFFEDFDGTSINTTKWTNSGLTSATVGSGVLNVPTGTGSWNTGMYSNTVFTGAYTMDVRHRHNGTGTNQHMLFGVKNTSTSVDFSAYPHFAYPRILSGVDKRASSYSNSSQTRERSGLQSNVWNDFRIDLQSDGNARFLVKYPTDFDYQMYENVRATNASSFRFGISQNNQNFSIDRVIMYKPIPSQVYITQGQEFETLKDQEVFFGANKARNVRVINDTLVATAPASTLANPKTGSVDITVVTPSQPNAVLTNGYTYSSAQITSVTPNQIPTKGGVEVEVVGYKFSSSGSFSFQGSLITPTELKSDRAKFVLPASTLGGDGTGSTSIVYTDALGNVSNNGTINFILANVSSLSTSSGPNSGGTMVTLNGAGFNTNGSLISSVTLDNPNDSASENVEIPIVFDTKTKIDQGLMNANCSDIRTFYQNEATTISHWLESGCNTEETTLWVRIPSVVAGKSTVIIKTSASPADTSDSSIAPFSFSSLFSTAQSGDTNVSVVDGLELHLDAGSLSGSNSTQVSTWNDISGKNNNVTQSTAGQRPLLFNNIINGRKVVRFDGTDDRLISTSPISMNDGEASIFVVKKRNNINANRNIVGLSEEGGAYQELSIVDVFENSDLNIGAVHRTNRVQYSAEISNRSTANFQVVSGEFGRGVDQINISVDGVESELNPRMNVSADPHSKSVRRAYIGGDSEGLNIFAGDIAEVLVYNRLLSDEDVKKVECYLGVKYGITTSGCGGNIRMWLKANETSIANLANGAKVTQLTDQSGNNNNATNGVVNQQPIVVKNGLNSMPVLRFAGSTPQYLTTTTNFPQPYSLMFVGRQTGGLNRRVISGVSSNYTIGYNNGFYHKMFDGIENENYIESEYRSDTQWRAYTATSDGRFAKLYNGTDMVVNSIRGLSGPNGLHIGGDDSNTLSSDSEVAEVMVFNRSLEEHEVALLNRYINSKYRITSNGNEPRIEGVYSGSYVKFGSEYGAINKVEHNTIQVFSPALSGTVNVEVERLGTLPIVIPSGFVFGSNAKPNPITTLEIKSNGSPVLLSWQKPNSNGSEITDYTIVYSDNDFATETVFNDGVSTATNTLVTNLNPETSYSFKVRAVNSVGTSEDSNIVEYTAKECTIDYGGSNVTVASGQRLYLTGKVCGINTLTIDNNGTLDVFPQYNNESTEIHAQSITNNGTITAENNGYSRRWTTGSGFGPGGGGALNCSSPWYASGAGHGGNGGSTSVSNSSTTVISGGSAYGSIEYPITIGSSGGKVCDSTTQSTGGGGSGIKLVSSGAITNNGSINANGSNSLESYSGGGAGGSVLLLSQTLSGSGTITANGGNGGGQQHVGGASGGRIALYYESSTLPLSNVSANGGNTNTGIVAQFGGAGTIFYKDTNDTSNPNGSLRIGISNNATRRGETPIASHLTSLTTFDDLSFAGISATRINDAITLRNTTLTLPVSATLFTEKPLTLPQLTTTQINGTWDQLESTTDSLGNLTLGDGTNTALLTHRRNFSQEISKLTVNANNITISTNAQVNTNGLGAIGNKVMGNGFGLGGGTGFGCNSPYYSSGAGYGGNGGSGVASNLFTIFGGKAYGSIENPTSIGSSGGAACASTTQSSGSGGGAIRLTATGTITNNGSISANGTNATEFYASGGSGGSVFLTSQTLSGSGTITANGGASGNWANTGGGAGGRIALYYESSTLPLNNVSANGGSTGATGQFGGAGTIFYKDTNDTSNPNGSLRIGISNNATRRGETPIASHLTSLTTFDDLSFAGISATRINDAITLRNTTLTLPVSATLFTEKPLTFAQLTTTQINGTWDQLESTTDSLGNLTVGDGTNTAILTHRRNFSQEISKLTVNANNITISTNAQVNTNGLGFVGRFIIGNGFGQGGGTGFGCNSPYYSSGGGYGGNGGSGLSSNGSTVIPGGSRYGSLQEPTSIGSSGGAACASATQSSGSGGGAIRLTATGTITNNGSISANGTNATEFYASGGSGGSVFLTSQTLSGSGTITSNGGNHGGWANTGGGAGGRIALVYQSRSGTMTQGTSTSSITVNGGTGYGNCSEDLNSPVFSAYNNTTGGCTGTIYDPNTPQTGITSASLTSNPNPVSLNSSYTLGVTNVLNTFGFSLFSGTCSIQVRDSVSSPTYNQTLTGNVSNGVCTLSGQYTQITSLGTYFADVTVTAPNSAVATRQFTFTVFPQASNTAKQSPTNSGQPIFTSLTANPSPSIIGFSTSGNGNEVVITASGLIDHGNDQPLNSTSCSFQIQGPNSYSATFNTNPNALVGGVCSYIFDLDDLPSNQKSVAGTYTVNLSIAGNSGTLTTPNVSFDRNFNVFTAEESTPTVFSRNGVIPGTNTSSQSPIVSGGGNPVFTSPIFYQYNNTTPLPQGLPCRIRVEIDSILLNEYNSSLNSQGRCSASVPNNSLTSGVITIQSFLTYTVNSNQISFNTAKTTIPTTGFPSNLAKSDPLVSSEPERTSFTVTTPTLLRNNVTASVIGLKDSANNQPLNNQICTFVITDPNSTVTQYQSAVSSGDCVREINGLSELPLLDGNYSIRVEVQGSSGTLTTPTINFVRNYDIFTTGGLLPGTIQTTQNPLLVGTASTIASPLIRRADNVNVIANGTVCKNTFQINSGTVREYVGTISSGRCQTSLPSGDIDTSGTASLRTIVSLFNNDFNSEYTFQTALTTIPVSFPPTAKICLHTFRDDNSNQIQDGVEPLLANVYTELRTSGGTLITWLYTNSTSIASNCFNTLFDGTYTVRQYRPTNGTTTIPSGNLSQPSYSVTLSPAQESTVLFGYNGSASICPNQTYIDVDGNGVFNGSDTLLAGRVISLYRTSNLTTPYATLTTDGTVNSPCFVSIPPDNYRLVVDIPAGMEATTGTMINGNTQVIRDVTLAFGISSANQPFGFKFVSSNLAKPQPSPNQSKPVNTSVTLSTVVNPTYNEKSFVAYPVSAQINGLLDSNTNQPLNGTGICQAVFSGPSFSSPVTITSKNVVNGVCSITNSDNVIPTSVANGNTVTFSVQGVAGLLTADPHSFDVTTGNATLTIAPFADYNQNGTRQAGEVYLSGYQTSISNDGGGTTLQTINSNSGGTAQFTSLTPGIEYTITQTPLAGTSLTTGTLVRSFTPLPEEIKQEIYSYTGNGSVQPAIFNDVNRNGINDSENTILNSFSATLKDTFGTTLVSNLVLNGTNSFTNLIPSSIIGGNYTIEINEGSLLTTHTTSNDPLSLSLTESQNLTPQFGYASNARICPNPTFMDYNSNGSRDGIENLLSLQTRLYRTSDNALIGSLLTNNTNCFEQVNAGEYYIEQVIPSGGISTASGVTAHTVCPSGYTWNGSQCEERTAKVSQIPPSNPLCAPDGNPYVTAQLEGEICKMNGYGSMYLTYYTIPCLSGYYPVNIFWYDASITFIESYLCIPNAHTGFASPSSSVSSTPNICPNGTTYKLLLDYGEFSQSGLCIPNSQFNNFEVKGANTNCSSLDISKIQSIYLFRSSTVNRRLCFSASYSYYRSDIAPCPQGGVLTNGTTCERPAHPGQLVRATISAPNTYTCPSGYYQLPSNNGRFCIPNSMSNITGVITYDFERALCPNPTQQLLYDVSDGLLTEGICISLDYPAIGYTFINQCNERGFQTLSPYIYIMTPDNRFCGPTAMSYPAQTTLVCPSGFVDTGDNTPTPCARYSTTNSTVIRKPVTISFGVSQTHPLGYRGDGAICPYPTFEDWDKDGVHDVGEPMISNVATRLKDADGDTVFTIMTDNTTCFQNLLPGQWRVEQTPPSNTISTTGTPSRVVDVAIGQTVSTAFGYDGSPQICPFAYLDINQNGIFDTNEVKLAGSTIQLRNSDGTVIHSTLTSSLTSTTCFTYSTEINQTYQVTSAPFGGYTLTTPSPVTLSNVGFGQQYTPSFGFYGASTICIENTFLDSNNNGVRNSGETYYGGLDTTLKVVGSTSILQTIQTPSALVTDPNNEVCFTPVQPGSYLIEQTAPTGSASTTGSSQQITVSASEIKKLNFGYNGAGTLCYSIYDDGNFDGDRDGGESQMSGVTLNLALASSPTTIITSLTSSSTQQSCFGNLFPETYVVNLDSVPSGYAESSSPLLRTAQITLANQFITRQTGVTNHPDFVLGAIRGFVYMDRNENGEYNSFGQDTAQITVFDNDIPVTEQEVKLFKLNTMTSQYEEINSILTNIDGTYAFTALVPGTYYTVLPTPLGTKPVLPALDPSPLLANAQQSGPFVITADEKFASINYSLQYTARVCPNLFLDRNNNGVYEPNGADNNPLTTNDNDINLISERGGFFQLHYQSFNGNQIASNYNVKGYFLDSTNPCIEHVPPRDYNVVFRSDLTNGLDGNPSYASLFDITLYNQISSTSLPITIFLGTENTSTNFRYFTTFVPNYSTGTINGKVWNNRPVISSFDSDGDDNLNGSDNGYNREYDNDFVYPNATLILRKCDTGFGETQTDVDNWNASPPTTTSDSQGNYSFSNIPPGSYAVEWDPNSIPLHGSLNASRFNDCWWPSNYINWHNKNTSPPAGAISPGSVVNNYDIFFTQKASIGLSTFIDQNQNQIREFYEPTNIVQGIWRLKDSNNLIVYERTSTPTSLSYVKPGTYTLEFSTTDTRTPLEPLSYPVTISENTISDTYEIAFAPLTGGQISGKVMIDRNGDRIHQQNGIDGNATTVFDNDIGQAGVIVELLNNAHTVIATATTNTNGDYTFSNIIEGYYYVQIPNPSQAGLKCVECRMPYSFQGYGVEYIDSTDNLQVNLTYNYNGRLNLRSYYDTVPDFVFDTFWEVETTEPTYYVVYEDGYVLGTLTNLIDIPGGNYTITVNNIPSGSTLTQVTNPHTFSLLAGENITKYHPLTPQLNNSLSGDAFADKKNLNKTFEANGVDNNNATTVDNDIPLTNATISIIGPLGTYQTTVNANAEYIFNNLPSGRYVLHTFDSNDTSQNNPIPNISSTNPLFTDMQDVCMTVLIDGGCRWFLGETSQDGGVWSWAYQSPAVSEVIQGIVVRRNDNFSNNYVYVFTNEIRLQCVDDLNGDGQVTYYPDTGYTESPIAGCSYTIRLPSGEVVATSNALTYRINYLPPDDYTIELNSYPSNRIITNALRYNSSVNNFGSVTTLVNTFPLSNRYQNGFINFMAFINPITNNSSITGKVFIDRNSDGFYQPFGIDNDQATKEDNDILLKGIPLELTIGATRSTSTAIDGKYQFTDLPAGNYRVNAELESR